MIIYTPKRIHVWKSNWNIKYKFMKMLTNGNVGTNGTLKFNFIELRGWRATIDTMMTSTHTDTVSHTICVVDAPP